MRPLPIYPRGPRRAKPRRETILLGCPKLCPDWELSALRTLMKPQQGGAIRHRASNQRWPTQARALIEQYASVINERLGVGLALHLLDDGDYHLAAMIPREHQPAALALSMLVTRELPRLWFVLDRLFIRDGRPFRRERGYKLKLVEATNVHLPREVRTALRGVL